METATVIHEGECQTVRLPKGFHLSATTVGVRHEGEAIVLEPLKPRLLRKFLVIFHWLV